MKVSIITMGCRVNQSESDDIEALLADRGLNIVDLKDNPDYCIVNTCAVTAASERQCRQVIRKAARQGAKVFVMGCYSQLREADVGSIAGVAGIIDIRHKTDVIGLIAKETRSQSAAAAGRARPYVKVQDGCNFACAYCTVPLARGRSRSIPAADVIRRVRSLESFGYREVVLTGIHLGLYGYDLGPKVSLLDLLGRILDVTKSIRIRLSSLEAGEISGGLLDFIAGGRVCNHLHIPLQSGSDRVLRAMRRGYDSSGYRRVLDSIFSGLPNVAVGTDVIAGFPGERPEDFDATLKLIEEFPLAYLHRFPYSKRPGTAAASMTDQVGSTEIGARMERLRQTDDAKRLRYRTMQSGRHLEVVMEERLEGSCLGTSANYLKVRFATSRFQRGSLVEVKVDRTEDMPITATLLQETA
jgi:threonylcarbamoyladenosine tRNA methylthiotransferase MtaB